MSAPQFKPLFSLVHNYLEKWAAETPEKEALIQHESEWIINYRQFNEMAELYALCLIKLGVEKGDRVAAMALQSIQYVALQYACFKIGVIICPLDIRLKPHEVVRALHQITPALFLMHGTTPLNDFYDVGKLVLEECPYVKHVLQYSFSENEPLVKGALRANDIFNLETLAELVKDRELVAKREKMRESVNKNDAAIIIFTTGTTGDPKPALIQHECIVAETEIFSRASVVPGHQVRRVCVLPVSHVGGSTITVYTTVYTGGTNILLHLFNPEKTLAAIEKWKGNWLGGVPTMYRMIWALPNYRDYDLTSLKVVYYAGSAVDKEFLYT